MQTEAKPTRVLARAFARELTQDELDIVAGGDWKTGTSPTQDCYYDHRYGRTCTTRPDDSGVEYDF